MNKRIMAFILSIAMVLGCCNVGVALAAEPVSGSCGKTATYTLNEEGSLVISGTGKVEYSWDDFSADITSVVIEEGITEIGKDAFYDCTALESIVFPETLAVIGESAFEACTSLEEITLPEKVTAVEAKLFYGCNSLSKVVLSEKTEIIKKEAFSRCENLEVITIPESVLTVEEAFYKVTLIHNMSSAEGSPWGAKAVHEYPADNCPECFTGDYVCEHARHELAYKWAADYSACEAVFTCTVCKEEEHIECEVAEEITPATCTGTGQIVYTATCRFEGDPYKDVKKVILEATGHQWDKGVLTKEPTEEETGELVYTCQACAEKKVEILDVLEHEYREIFEWSDDNQTCNAIFTCVNCDDVQEIECEVTAKEIAATCTEEGKIVYTAKCEFNDDTYFNTNPNEDVIPATGHTYIADPVWTWAEDMVTATAVFTCSVCEETEEIVCEVVSEQIEDELIYTAECEFEGETYESTKAETVIPFTDVSEDKWYYEYVVWGYENDVANGIKEADGTYTFRPDESCTRAQFVQFLWGLVGTEASEDVENPFTDIEEDKWYYDAVMWAVENDVTAGVKEADGTYKFRPNETCTRAQAAQFLYHLLGEDVVVEDVENPFTDIEEDTWYYDAVIWGYAEGIIAGIEQSDGTYKFAPNDEVTRAQVVKMINCAYEDAPVTGIALDESEIVLTEGEKYGLSFVLNPSYAANKNVVWTSSDKTVAKVSSRGVVTAISFGTATITVTTEDGGFVASCEVVVKDPELTAKVVSDIIWIPAEDGTEVKSLSVKVEATGGSEVYEEYLIKAYLNDELIMEEESDQAVVTPVSSESYKIEVYVKDSHGNEVTAEKIVKVS